MPVPAPARRAGTRTAALAALVLAGTALSGAPAFAQPIPGDNGDVKIHDVNTPVDDPRNDPKVCEFYLAGFNFDPNEDINWSIVTQPEVAGGAVRGGSLQVDATGAGHTGEITLPNGQYKLTWLGEDSHGVGKFKVFQVDCPGQSPSPTPTPTPTPKPGGHHGGPHGGPPAGGGGIARTEAFTPVAGAAAVGLATVTGVIWFRLRRRPNGAA
jgi:hypothetical protein